jgi:hypothetical protein
MIASLSFADSLYALGIFIIGAKRYIHYYFNKSDTISVLNCLFLQLLIDVPAKPVFFLIIALGVDRLLSVAAPIFYDALDERRYVIGVNLICWASTLFWVPVPFFIHQNIYDTIPICQTVLVYTARYQEITGYINTAAIILMILIYTSIAVIVACRYWKSNWINSNQRNEWFQEVQKRTLKTVIAIGVCHVIFFGCSSLAYTVFSQFLVESAVQKVMPFTAIFSFIDAVSHFFIYLLFSSQFRGAFFNMFTTKTMITPLQS